MDKICPCFKKKVKPDEGAGGEEGGAEDGGGGDGGEEAVAAGKQRWTPVIHANRARGSMLRQQAAFSATCWAHKGEQLQTMATFLQKLSTIYEDLFYEDVLFSFTIVGKFTMHYVKDSV